MYRSPSLRSAVAGRIVARPRPADRRTRTAPHPAFQCVAETTLHHGPDLGRAPPGRRTRLPVADRLALRLESPELDPQHVVLAEMESQLLRRHLQQLQQLLVGQQVPVSPHQRDVHPRAESLRHRPVGRQAHRRRQGIDLLLRRSHQPRQPCRRHQVPVPPYQRVQPIGEVLEQDLRRLAPTGGSGSSAPVRRQRRLQPHRQADHDATEHRVLPPIEVHRAADSRRSIQPWTRSASS